MFDGLLKRSGYPTRRLQGDVSMMLPPSWHLIGTVLFLSVLAALFFLASASYSRVVTVRGVVVPTVGMPQITASRAGVVRQLLVGDGSRVAAGTELIEIASDERLADGASPSSELIDALAGQDDKLAVQRDEIDGSARARNAGLAARAEGIRREIDRISEQIETQKSLIAVADEDLEQAELLLSKGYGLRRDVLDRKVTQLSRRQDMAGLRQSLARQKSLLEEAAREEESFRADTAAKLAELDVQRSVLHQNRLRVMATAASRLTSPVAGRVTGFTARVGQAVRPGQVLMTVVPERARLVAELRVPNDAYGFVRVGQEARIAFDSFPFERFGTLTGRMLSVSRASVDRDGADASFLATVGFDRSYMIVYGERRPLAPGMTVSVNIVGEKQSLLRWLLDPIFALQNR